jgi:hypothetical protein
MNKFIVSSAVATLCFSQEAKADSYGSSLKD